VQRRDDRRFWGVIGLFLLLIALIVGYNAVTTSRQQDSALIVNVAGRQRALAERYIKDILLEVDGLPADPAEDAAMLTQNAKALLDGGEVLAVQGADASVRISRVHDPKSRAKLRQAQVLIRKLLATGDTLILQRDRASPTFTREFLRLRIVGAEVSSVTSDAVGELTQHAGAALKRLVWVGLGLGLLGAVAAIAMGLLLRRAERQQSAQFRSLVHNASDLVTVLDVSGTIRYQSASSEQVLKIPSSSILGTNLLDAVHRDDAPAVRAALEDAMRHPNSVARIEFRVRDGGGRWRNMESAVANSISDPSVRGLVLNTRDVTERHEADRKLKQLQAERGSLLEQTVHATELERKRVAAELHDGPVQHLTALDLRLESLRQRLGSEDASAAAELLDRLQDRLRGEVKELRRMMAGLRPPMLDERGLPAALREHLGSLGRDGDTTWSLEAELPGRLDPSHEVILYRVAQEAITNILKHANARQAHVILRESAGHIVLEVCDDGVGFDPSVQAASPVNGHYGLLGMRERVELAGGRWTVVARPGEGTVVRADLPTGVRTP